VLSEKLRSEFLAVQQLVRLVVPDNAETGPALLIKANSLALKYLVRRKQFTFLVTRLEDSDFVLYAVKIDDDPNFPAVFWSLAQEENELKALHMVTERGRCDVFLFNEGAINVCSASILLTASAGSARVLAPVALPGNSDLERVRSEVGRFLDISHRQHYANMHKFVPSSDCKWQTIRNFYITNQLQRSMIDLVNGDEGDQQETLAVWLTDALSITGAIQRPEVHEVSGPRELTDVLFSYVGGCFLVESKTLSVLDRSELPDRMKLKKNVLKNISKALSQLPGACRNIKRGLKITDQRGEEVTVERSLPTHCVILVPDLSLLDENDGLGGNFTKAFLKENAAYLHFLDPDALLRSVQHAYMLLRNSKAGMPLIAGLDAALMIRWQKAAEHTTPNVDLLMRVE